MSNTERALVVVPTYNERDNVHEIAGRILAADPSFDVLFVDDNSPDGTGTLLDVLATNEPRITVLHRAGKLGLGTAYRDAFTLGLSRGYGMLIEMDADGSHDAKYLASLVMLLKSADVAIGSRYVAGGGTQNWGPLRRLISRGGGLYARTILGLTLQDVTSGFIAYRASALRAIDHETVTSNGYSFQIEMKYRAVARGLQVVETPIIFVDRRVGKSKMSKAIFVEALMMVWKLRTRK